MSVDPEFMPTVKAYIKRSLHAEHVYTTYRIMSIVVLFVMVYVLVIGIAWLAILFALSSLLIECVADSIHLPQRIEYNRIFALKLQDEIAKYDAAHGIYNQKNEQERLRLLSIRIQQLTYTHDIHHPYSN